MQRGHSLASESEEACGQESRRRKMGLRDGAGLHGLRLHDLRHTVLTELAEMGGPATVAGSSLSSDQSVIRGRFCS